MTAAGVATVARQEFRLRIRAGRWRALLTAFFLVLLVFTVLLRGAMGTLAPEELPYTGTVLFGGLALFVLALALLVVPALAAQSVNGDRERGVLATLQVTRLSAGEIALGKFAAAWGTSLVFLALTLPLVAYAMTQGGVPVGRVVVVLLVLTLLLGTVCAVSLLLSAVLARTTTSGVLAYLAVFALSVGTVVVFALGSAMTAEERTITYENDCTDLPPDSGCVEGTQAYQTTQWRTDRTWWLLAANPFVVLADAAPQLPPELRRTDVDGTTTIAARDLDPLGQIGSAVRDLRRPPEDLSSTAPLVDELPVEPPRPSPVWPTGLAVNALLGVGALVLTERRLRTPTRTLPRGQRVA